MCGERKDLLMIKVEDFRLVNHQTLTQLRMHFWKQLEEAAIKPGKASQNKNAIGDVRGSEGQRVNIMNVQLVVNRLVALEVTALSGKVELSGTEKALFSIWQLAQWGLKKRI